MGEKTIRINEHFLSIQGEGRFTGKSSYFVRVFSCNLRCPGFGLKPGETNTEIPAIIQRIDQYRTLKDLPLSETGCDSYPASWPEFKRFATDYTYQQLVETIKLDCGEDPTGIDLVITGGEPLIKGTQNKLAELFDTYHDYFSKFDSITFETNGTQTIQPAMIEYLANKFTGPVVFSISPKLACSGEPQEKTIKPEAIQSIKDAVSVIKQHRSNDFDIANTQLYLKFVVTNQNDVDEINDVANKLNFVNHVDGDIYLMPCGGTFEQHNRNAKAVAELAIKHRMLFCYRVHCAVWRNDWSR